jgi:uncharacterized membrane protein
MVYSVFYWIHVVSFVVWGLAFLLVLWKYYQIKNANSLAEQLPLIRTERKITNIGGHIGAVGILISGGAIASIPPSEGFKWGWFNEAYPWLSVKQGVFFLIIILFIFAAINSVRFKKMLRNDTDGELTPNAKDQWMKAFRLSMTIYVLVVINIILGYTRPF